MIFSIGTQKGGVGKTTTSLALAAGLAQKGKRVLLIDIDYQANSSKVLLPEYQKLDMQDTICSTVLERRPFTVHKTSVENLEIVPSHILLSNADLTLITALDNRAQRLKIELDKVQDRWDYVFIDCPPSLGLLTLNALVAADSVLVPLQCEFYALEGLGHLVRTIERVKRSLNPRLELKGVLLTMFDRRNNLSDLVAADVRGHFGDKVFETVIPRNVRISEAPSHGKPVLLYDFRCAGAQAYIHLAGEVLRRERSKAA
jgi:chromosome partitioning protein